MIKSYITKYNSVTFKLKFKSRIVVIQGDSGVGKTMLFKALKRDMLFGNNNMVCINYENAQPNILKHILKNNENKMIIIDNADILLIHEDKFKIAMDQKNQYIIFGREIDGFHLAKNEIAILRVNNNIGTLDYDLF